MLADTFIVNQLLEEASQRWGIYAPPLDTWEVTPPLPSKPCYVAVFISYELANSDLADAQRFCPDAEVRPITLAELASLNRAIPLIPRPDITVTPVGYVVFYDLVGTMEIFNFPEDKPRCP